MKVKLSLAAVLMFTSLILSGCATKVEMTVDRPAEIDLYGAEVMEVLPFQASDAKWRSSYFDSDYFDSDFYFDFSFGRGHKDEEEIVDAFQKLVENAISNSGYYTLLSTSSYRDYISSRSKNNTDVYMVGEIYNYRNSVEKSESTRKDDNDNVKVIISYKRNVDFDFAYQFIEASSTQVLYTGSFSISDSSYSYDKESDLPDAYEVVKSSLSSKASTIARAIKPNQETRSLKLLRNKNNDEMELANKYAKNGLVDESYSKYISVYENNGIFEAGYNAAIILEAKGKLEEAEEIAEKLTQTGDKRAFKLLSDIKYEITQRDEYLRQKMNSGR